MKVPVIILAMFCLQCYSEIGSTKNDEINNVCCSVVLILLNSVCYGTSDRQEAWGA